MLISDNHFCDLRPLIGSERVFFGCCHKCKSCCQKSWTLNLFLLGRTKTVPDTTTGNHNVFFINQPLEWNSWTFNNPRQLLLILIATARLKSSTKRQVHVFVLKLSSIRLVGRAINDVYFEGCNPFKSFTMDANAQMVVRMKRRFWEIHMCV